MNHHFNAESTLTKLKNRWPARGPHIERFLQELSDIPPAPCDFKKGDLVKFTNEYGVAFEGFRIIGFAREINLEWRPDSFIYLDKEAYWFPVSADELELEQHSVLVEAKETERELFPSYKQHEELSEFINAVLATGHMMFADGAVGSVLGFLPHVGAAEIDMQSLEELLTGLEAWLQNPDSSCESFMRYEMILFDGGNIHGDSWIATIYPKQMIQVFVCQTVDPSKG